MSQDLQQKNLRLPPALIAAINRYKCDLIEREAQKLKNSDVVAQALFFWFGPFGSLGLKQALWKAKVEKAAIVIEKRLGGKDVDVKISAEDITEIVKQLRDAIPGDELRLILQSQT